MSAPKGEETPEVFREAILYREWAYRLASLQKYPTAIDYFEKASELTKGEDLRSLIGLCGALINYMKYPAAGRISEKCIEIDPSHYKVKQMRMETLFQMGEFGHSLAEAYQGSQRHRMTFEHGIYQGNETVEDCIGRNTSPEALLLLYPWIHKLTEYREALIGKLEEEEDELEGINENDSKFKVNDSDIKQQTKLRRLQRVIAKMYMGYLAIDKNFLERIVRQPKIVDSSSSSTELVALANVCYRDIIFLQDRLRMRRPLYVTVFKRRNITKGHKMMIKQERKLRINRNIIEADFLLHRLHDSRVKKDYLTFFGLVERIKDKFDGYPYKIFPQKYKCLRTLYKMVAWVYIDTRNLMYLDNEEMKTRYLKHLLGIRIATLPRDRDLAWTPIINPKRMLNTFRRRLALASTSIELAWLHHEFCKFLINTQRYDLARFYCKKGRDRAQEAKSTKWILNIDHLILRIEIHQNNRNEARDAAISALTNARKLRINYLIDFYERCMKLVDEMDLERDADSDEISVRQQLILDLMPLEMKGTMDRLWRSMNLVPAVRRLSIMPGCKPIDRKFKMPSTRRSILPDPPKDTRKQAEITLLKQYVSYQRRPGYVNFEEFE